jgi:DNA (cytosine-5)-methyltransferase 1
METPTGSNGYRSRWARRTLWTGGFPCQDLSVAGKRRGMVAGTRSNLAHAFLDLVERHRPPAIVLENVPGLLSSHGGKDLGALLGRLGELGYGWAYRVLDARHFGVPQRRRRVFIVAFGAGTGLGADGAAEVLSVGSRCRRHPPTGVEAGEDAADGARPSALTSSRPLGHRPRTRTGTKSRRHLRVGPSPDAGRVRAADGLARRLDDRDGVANAISASADTTDTAAPRGLGSDNLVAVGLAGQRGDSSYRRAAASGVTPGGGSPARLLGSGAFESERHETRSSRSASTAHRYECCGNGVVAPVAEWLGARLAEALA